MMARRFFVLLTACFLLTFPFAAHADVIALGPVDIFFAALGDWGSTPQLLAIMLIVAVAIGTIALIRVFWKPNKGKKGD